MTIAHRDTWGEQGDGTYHNPILPGDYSDIDAIRVGDDFYAISSTFQFSPGITVIHSRDLVNWSILGHVIGDISVLAPRLNWDVMDAYGRGIWAPALRHHDGQFWVYFCTPDEGCFVCTATEATGPWGSPVQVFAAAGWDDCCPFWDEGKGYLVVTHFADGYKIHVFDLAPDNCSLVPNSCRVIHQSKGSEASKLFKHDGMIYHFFSEVHDEGRVPMMARAYNIDGPYEEHQLMHVDIPVDKEPNQGGLIELPDGRWYFVTHQGTGDWEGRALCLLPVQWIDGWPIIGEPGADGIGTMVWSGPMPLPAARVAPQSSDDFDRPTLGPQWQWNYQPRNDKWSLTERPGALRLHAFKPIRTGDFRSAGNTLTQRSLRTAANVVMIKLDIGAMADGQQAGVCHFSYSYSLFGIVQGGTTRTLSHTLDGIITPVVVVEADTIWLRSRWGRDGHSHYAYSLDGTAWIDTQASYQLAWGAYRGDRFGVYSFNEQTEDGFVDVDWVRYEYADH
jgi:beta-xylosidase